MYVSSWLCTQTTANRFHNRLQAAFNTFAETEKFFVGKPRTSRPREREDEPPQLTSAKHYSGRQAIWRPNCEPFQRYFNSHPPHAGLKGQLPEPAEGQAPLN